MEVKTEKKIIVEFVEEEAKLLRDLVQNCSPEESFQFREFCEELFCTLNVELEGTRR